MDANWIADRVSGANVGPRESSSALAKGDSSALDEIWLEQNRWSLTANRLKRDIERRRQVVLLCTVAGAVLSAAGVLVGLSRTGGQLLAFAGAIAVGLAQLSRSRVGPNDLGQWTRARSVAEAIKSDVYTHLALGAPDVQALAKHVAELQDDAADLRPLVALVQPKRRALPQVEDFESYVRIRVGGQIDNYYRPRATLLAHRLSAVRKTEGLLAAMGVVVGAAAGTWSSVTLAVWLPVITTAAAAVTAHAAAARYEYSLVEYLRTAEELDRMRRRSGAAHALTPPELVALAERVISIQNEGWMAKLSAPDGADG